MPDDTYNSLNKVPLDGAHIWLSGAVPDGEGVSEENKEAIRKFVREFSRLVFQKGGHIVHGSHPTLVNILLEEAKTYQEKGGGKESLKLAVSKYYSKNPELVNVKKWRESAVVHETPKVPGPTDEEDSKRILRQWMANRCDAVVAIGGKQWLEVARRRGIPQELSLALDRGLPCFLLGGLGGAAEMLVDDNPTIFSRLKNGLEIKENLKLAKNKNVGNLAERVCEQLERLPLVRGRGADTSRFRILALDGGGVKGAFTAAILASWEENCKKNMGEKRIVDHFDIIAGTSTGGILAIGLGMGLSAQEMLQFYKDYGAVIFPVKGYFKSKWRTIKNFFGPKHKQSVLHEKLEEAYYNYKKEEKKEKNPKYMKDSLCRLVIPSYHASSGKSYIFRTPHHPDLTNDANREAAYVALSTSAAPTFFEAAKVSGNIADEYFFDGGVWANSPALAAIVEAVRYLGIPLERIEVLSIGTTAEPFSASKQKESGFIGWGKKILDLLMKVQQESSIKMSEHLLPAARFLRVDETTAPGDYDLDSAKKIDDLASLGNETAMDANTLKEVKTRFLNGVEVYRWNP